MKSGRKFIPCPTFALACLFSPALADTGPCKPYPPLEVLVCGSGDGAAIVIRDTTSPSKKFALAWRTVDAPPFQEPEGQIDLVVIRLDDGGILSKTSTEYWDTGEAHANRLQEHAFWSADNQFMIRESTSRFSSDVVELYTIGAEDIVTGPFDLLTLIEPPLRKRLKPYEPDADGFALALAAKGENEKTAEIDNRGRFRLEVMLWAPKDGPMYYYTVQGEATRAKSATGKISARIVSIRYRGMEKSN
jgi:hypothetical protein